QDVGRLAVLARDRDLGVGRPLRTRGKVRFVLSAVELGPDVVAHPAVHSKIAANAGYVLDRADRVHRDAGMAGDRRPWLDDKLRAVKVTRCTSCIESRAI